ncbi:hypothetical protein EBBID32_50 [Sphingobium indicum BiD32]|jgi:hypothetical protein|uniref:Uncharacterized protein n=2 Tax=Sphingobium TaxID=165695 RepID=N1MFZ5_9SPHN|nr:MULTISPECIES: hypothetical protein [Sphingobium]RJG57289.1 hypothetical protein D0Z70_03535 [Sphingobium terrigena]CCW15679.1 hypothetical protein EBBID32_50 [Sphingobium indicum BiD32]
MAVTDYHSLAAQARTDADAATLANVRDRCLRAEAAWLAMAQRQDLTDTARARRENAAADARAERLADAAE